MTIQKISPNLRYNDQAEEAARSYTSLCKASAIGQITLYHKALAQASDSPEKSVLTVNFQLAGQDTILLNSSVTLTHQGKTCDAGHAAGEKAGNRGARVRPTTRADMTGI